MLLESAPEAELIDEGEGDVVACGRWTLLPPAKPVPTLVPPDFLANLSVLVRPFRTVFPGVDGLGGEAREDILGASEVFCSKVRLPDVNELGTFTVEEPVCVNRGGSKAYGSYSPYEIGVGLTPPFSCSLGK